MSFCLNVPFVTQLGIGSHAGVVGLDDPTGCWYASACMVGYSFEYGPRQGVPELYTRPLSETTKADGSKKIQYGHYVINAAWIPTLKSREHLVSVNEPGTKAWTINGLHELLKKYGPIFYGWIKTNEAGNSYGHASVIIGVDKDNNSVVFHDPENKPFSRLPLNDFNAKFIWGAGFTLRRSGDAFQHNIQLKN